MNLVIKNQNNRILDSLNIEIIKTLDGEFSLEELESELMNLYFNKSIIDITSIRNHYDINSVIMFLKGFDPEKTIILLNDSEIVNNDYFLGKLVENGVYNFTRNAAGVNYLLTNPNTEADVSQYIKPSADSGSLNQTYDSDYQQENTYKEEVREEAPKESYDNSYKVNTKQTIIGLQNLTDHAGATSLAHQMIKQLKLNYSVKGIEMNKQDFIYFRDSDCVFCTSIDDFKLRLREFSNVDIIIVDLNEFDASEFCEHILYLVDPGTVRLNKLFKKDKNIIDKVKNGKIVLNRSSIKAEDLKNFEYETKFKVFFNMPNFDDRKDRTQVVDTLLNELGFQKQNPESSGFFGSLFGK